jgi:hypothetical protein
VEWRRPKAEDLDLFLRVHPETLGPEPLTTAQADRIWRRLLSAKAFQGAFVTRSRMAGAESVTGVGASVFVDDCFAENELNDPRPALNARIVRGQLEDSSLAFSRDKIAEANSSGGVNVVILAGRWNPALVDEEEINEARLTLSTAFSEVHMGYRFKRILIELIDAQDRKWASAVPYMRIHAAFPGGTRALAIIEKSNLEANDATVLAQHFSCPSPRLFLRASDQELLLAALDNPTDEWLRRELGLSKEAVKRRWSVLFERIDREMPELFESAKTVDRRVRGPQKRHVVLAYVRKRPQELRPFARATAANGFS